MCHAAGAAVIPPLMTSGTLCPLSCPFTSTSLEGGTSGEAALTSLYEDVATAVRSDNGSLIAHSAVLHEELATFDIGASCIVRRGAVLRPPIRVYVNQSAAAAPPTVAIGSFTFVGVQVVCEAAEVGQMVRMDEECVVAAGARIPDGVWLLPKTWVPAEAVLAPYTVYCGVPARPTAKLNARVYQLQHLQFLRELRALGERDGEATVT